MLKEADPPSTQSSARTGKPGLPIGGNLVVKCQKCKELLVGRDWEKNLKVCPRCDFHFKLSANERIALLIDPDSFLETDREITAADPLEFVSPLQVYAQKVGEERENAQLNEAVVIGHATIEGLPVELAIMDFRFIGGSMSSAVGEKITRAIEAAIEKRIPLLIASASGGARMQESFYSLMQMAKTSAALARLGEAHIPFFSLLTDPTTGGVTASFAMLGDVILAEPGVLICFAGPRVIEGFMHIKLPEGAVTSEFVLQHGMIDAVVHRRDLRQMFAKLLRLYGRPEYESISRLTALNRQTKNHQKRGRRDAMAYDLEFEKPLAELEKRIVTLQRKADRLNPEEHQQWQDMERELRQQTEEIYNRLSEWQTVQVARHKDRPYTADYIHLICDDFFELHGDRIYADDHSFIAGITKLDGQSVMVIGHQKGRDMKEKQFRNLGMPHPEGYRKTARLMKQAEKFGFPIICLIDTAGAFPALGDEERGQATAIAENLYLMSHLHVPIIAVVIGEGGSGGALAISVADRILMMEYTIYAVAAPEAAANILWHDKTFAPQAAEAMRISARQLKSLGLIDEIIPEPLGGAHHNYRLAADNLKAALVRNLHDLQQFPIDELLEQRYQKFRTIGVFSLKHSQPVGMI